MSLVSLVQARNRDLRAFKKAIERSLDLIQFRFNRNARRVVVKPNLCYYQDYSTGQTTDPKFVSALIEILREHLSSDSEILVIESDASAMRCKYAFRMLGYEKMAEEKGITLVNLTKDKYKEIDVNVGGKYYKFCVPQTIVNANILINVPKIKYMSQTGISCALKNIYGCNPYKKKFIYHNWLDEAIVSLNKIIKSDLCVVDGIVVRGISPLRLGLVMASTDPVAIDAAASRIAGLNPSSVRHIRLASREKIGNIHFVTKGDSLTYFSDLFPRKNIRSKMYGFLAWVYHHFFEEKKS